MLNASYISPNKRSAPLWERLLPLSRTPLRSLRLFLLIALMALFMGLPSPARAIGCSVSELISAMSGASSGSTIELAAGCTYTLTSGFTSTTGLPVISTTLTINGNGAIIERSTAAGTPNFRLMYVQVDGGNLTLNDVTLRNGKQSTGGGIVNLDRLTLNNTNVLDNDATAGGGGGLYNSSTGTMTLNDSTINSNRALAASGAGIWNHGTLTISSSQINSNPAFTNGGGIYNDGTTTLTDSSVSGNYAGSATVGGGGIFINAGTVTMTNGSVDGNVAANNGGAIYVNNGGTYTLLQAGNLRNNQADDGSAIYNAGTVTMTNGTVSGNTTTNNGTIYSVGTTTLTNSFVYSNLVESGGGAIYVSAGMTTVNSSSLSNNDADNGAGILVSAGTVMVNSSTLADNEASLNGGGIYSNGTVTVTTSFLSRNSAPNGPGGGIYNSGTVTVDASTLDDNITGTNGGGIFNGGTATVTNTTLLSGNEAVSGGGIYNTNAVTVSNSTFSDNSVTNYGGGIYNTSTVTVTNSTFNNNSAGDDGGGIYNTNTLNVTASALYNNVANTRGGAILNSGGTVTVTNSTFSANIGASGGGGAIRNSDGTLTVINSTFAANRADMGGAILSSSGTVNIGSDIFYGNIGITSGSDLFGAYASLGYNVISDTSNATITGTLTGNLTGAAASPLNLGALANNGGFTKTRALGGGSVAIGHGNCATLAGVAPVTTDQRGISRKTPCDVGAYENTPSTISDITNKTTNEDTPTAAIPFTIGDDETPPASLILSAGSSNTTKVPLANIVFGGSGANRTVTVTPGANQSGSVTITVIVSDGSWTTSDTFVLTITAVNDLPTISNVSNQQTPINTPLADIPFTIGDVETPASSLTLTRQSSNTTLVPLANIVFGGSGANRTVSLTPAANQTGTTTVTLTVQDANGATASDILVLTVGGDAIFSDSFESGNLNGWTSSVTDSGDLNVLPAAALMGSFGIQALIDDTAAIYVTDDSPNVEPRYRARFMFDPNSVTMANNDNFSFLFGFQGTSTSILQAQLRRSGGTYQVRVGAIDDGGTWLYSPFVTVTDEPHLFELDWLAATGAGANNGALNWWLDEVAQMAVTSLDTDTRRIDRVRLGGAGGIDAGTSGMVFFDAFISRRLTYIGRLIAAPSLVAPPDASFVAREVSPSLSWSSVAAATQYYAEFGNGTTVALNSGWIAGTSWAPGIQPQGPYTWRVKTRDASGEESAWSASRTLTVRPGVPTNLQGSALSLTQVSLTWNASIDAPAGITGYRIYRAGSQIDNVGSGVTSFTDNNAPACTANQYKVRSVNGSVTSLDSNVITVNTLCDPIFSDGFEAINLNAWSLSVTDGTNLATIPGAQLTGSTRGLRALINDANPLYVGDDTPVAEARYRARFYFDPNNVVMANNDNFSLFYGIQGTATAMLQVQLRKSGSAYQLRVAALDDDGTWVYSPYATISDAPHIVELDWKAASGAGANNGSLAWWVDETARTGPGAIDTDTRRVDRVRLGAVAGMDAGTSGTVYFDAFRSTRFSYIGAEAGGLGGIIEPTAEPTEEITPEATNEPRVEVTPEATIEPTAEVTSEATVEPTAEVTPEVTVEPTIESTAVPTEEPTAVPLPTETPTPEPTLLPFTLPVFQTMDDGAPLWSASAGWHLGADIAYSGLGWQAAASGQVETLALNAPVTLSAAAPTLSFQSKLVSGALPEIRLSLDGVTWQPVALVTPSLNWALVTVDLSAYAGQTIRLQFVWASPAGASDSWQVDEVTIAEGALLPPVEPTAPVSPVDPGSEPTVGAPTVAPRDGAMPDTPADLPQPPSG